tara:strand:- start:499 stop:783 length:285 start_codon:yes stop_codon:yes gene_type:complete
MVKMKTSIAYSGKLSQRQLVRLGGLIAFICGRRPYDTILNDLTENGFVSDFDNNLELTDLGRRELTRLVSMAGLKPEQFTDKAYQDEPSASPVH